MKRLLLVAFIITLASAAKALAQPPSLRDYRMSHPAPYADSHYWSPAFVAEFDHMTRELTDKGYWVMSMGDYAGTWYHVDSGARRTVGQPVHYTRTIWIFGNSGLEDPFVPDGYTAASQLQAKLVQSGLPWRVVNLAVDGQHAIGEYVRLTDTPVQRGDVVLFVDGGMDGDSVVKYQNVIERARIYSYGHAGALFYHFIQPYNQPVDFMTQEAAADNTLQIQVPPAMFIDSVHMNEHGAALVAQFLYRAIVPAF